MTALTTCRRDMLLGGVAIQVWMERSVVDACEHAVDKDGRIVSFGGGGGGGGGRNVCTIGAMLVNEWCSKVMLGLL